MAAFVVSQAVPSVGLHSLANVDTASNQAFLLQRKSQPDVEAASASSSTLGAKIFAGVAISAFVQHRRHKRNESSGATVSRMSFGNSRRPCNKRRRAAWVPGDSAAPAGVGRYAGDSAAVKVEKKETEKANAFLGFLFLTSSLYVAYHISSWVSLGAEAVEVQAHVVDAKAIVYKLHEPVILVLRHVVPASLLLVLSRWPQYLIRAQGKFLDRFIQFTFAQGTAPWYKLHASDVIGDCLSSVIKLALTYCASNLMIESLAGGISTALSGDLTKLATMVPVLKVLDMDGDGDIGDVTDLHMFAHKIFTAVLVGIIGKLVLALKNPPREMKPARTADVIKGSWGLWRPLMNFIADKSRVTAILDRLIEMVVYGIIAAVWLNIAKIRFQTVLAIGSVGSLAIGLAMKNLAANLVAGTMMFMTQTLREGTVVELVELKIRGCVHNVGMLHTTVDKPDGLRVTVPNSKILDGCVMEISAKKYNFLDEQFLVTIEGDADFATIVKGVNEFLQNYEPANQVNGHSPFCVLFKWEEEGAELRVRAFFPKQLGGAQALAARSELLIGVGKKVEELGGMMGTSDVSVLMPPKEEKAFFAKPVAA